MRLATQRSSATPPPLARHIAARSRLAIIRAQYNPEITLSLQKKCVAALLEAGIPLKNIERFSVPGCFEIPLLAQRVAAQGRFDVLIALGAVIRGDTFHFDLIANECARGVMEVALKHDVPIIFEVLATYNRRDALRRSGENRFNKGLEAAQAALSMLAALSRLEKTR